MGLREIAAADLVTIVENEDDFGWPITVTDPDDLTLSCVGLSTDVSQVIDPETGQAVTGRNASVTLARQTLLDAGLGMPEGISDSTKRPWVIEFDDINGSTHTFKVLEAQHDRALGCVVCLLEAYKPNA